MLDVDPNLLGKVEQLALVEEAREVQRAQFELSRIDYNEFAETVLKDEQTGEPLRQAWLHEMWSEVRARHTRAQIIAHVEAGKTQQFSIGVPLFELGRNPRSRLVVVSRTQGMAVKTLHSVKGYIERSADLHRIFPALKPGAKWSEKGLYVERPDGIREPSFQAAGYMKGISGARFDGVILDDFLDSSNTRTKHKRDECFDWFFAELYSRLTEDAWIYFIGNAWHSDDLYMRLEKMGWPTYKFPVQATHDLIGKFPALARPTAKGGFGIKLGDPTWPERWSRKRIAERKAILPPIEFARSMMCESRDDKDARFQRGWIDAALEKGEDLPIMATFEEFLAWDMEGCTAEESRDQVVWALDPDHDEALWWVVAGVDLSTGKADDLSSISVVAIDRATKRRFLLSVETGRWQVDEIIRRIKGTYARYSCMFLVENNGSQDFIVQILEQQTAIPIFPYTTGQQKSDPQFGIEVLAAELANNKWVFPSVDGQGATEDIQELIADMLMYTPDPRIHTGDRLMSLWFCQVLAARLERRQAANNRTEGVIII